ncbi:MAG: DUF1566 domain-containing protein [Sedimentisphaeraceae bacterium JB056]
MKNTATKFTIIISLITGITSYGNYSIIDTGQIRCYANTAEIEYPDSKADFFGQDAQYCGNQPDYTDNKDGTITDNVTALVWTKTPLGKMTQSQASAQASKCKVGGYTDWRLPTIKELYSLILFSGTDPDPMSEETSSQRPFIDTRYFDFEYGKIADGDRVIDSQFATSTIYKSTTMNGNKTMFGVNFADGRIKGYPTSKLFYVLYVRGNTNYGKNKFVDNGDGTITDNATGLEWMKIDNGKAMNWKHALQYAENLNYASHSDWRLPNAKELQSIVDYSRCPDATNSAAIDPIFNTTSIENEGGKKDYPFYWTSTSHVSLSHGSSGVYIAFGRGLGFMTGRRTGERTLMDVHGAGCQRSDPKDGNPSQYDTGRGPQGDVVRIYNFVRCVRGGKADAKSNGPEVELKSLPASNNTQNFASHFINRLDDDNDGKISRDEFDGPSFHFSKLDKNNNGYIELQEAPTSPPMQSPRKNPKR